jgi:hypothetical protein
VPRLDLANLLRAARPAVQEIEQPRVDGVDSTAYPGEFFFQRVIHGKAASTIE